MSLADAALALSFEDRLCEATPLIITIRYGYQDNAYFLTQGNGPWGPRAWTYDRIGNRLTESRGAITDSYVYPTNSTAGHNPKLESITLGAGGSRSYGYDAIGNTIQIVDDNQQLDLVHDASRRLTEMISRPDDRFVALAYDGRSFLSEVGNDDAGCFPRKTFALYDSEGLLHRREHHLLDGPGTVFLESNTVFSFAGRPLAALNLTPGTSKLTYLTTDHLGTLAAASSESGGLVWQGGFEPFGVTWNTLDAAEVAGEALGLLHRDESRLVMMAQSIRIECLIEIGEIRRALFAFQAARSLYVQFSEAGIQLRVLFMEARLLETFGKVREAEKRFEKAVQGFWEARLCKDPS